MLFSKRRVVLFVGGYGSGKTEVAVNYSLASRPLVTKLALVDLDVVNPYFRSRERIATLAEQGVKVIAPAGALASADLPALPGEISTAILDDEGQLVFDVGGDDVGARALGRYRHYLEQVGYDLWLVVNGCRPFTQTPELALSMLKSIEATSRLSVTGLINNTHLMQYTDLALVQRGETLVCQLSELTGLPLVFNAVVQRLVPAAKEQLQHPLLPLQLHMKRPWE
ncbi:MAG: hypothetical protein ACOX2K_01290 [Bacillota bacterium]|jgi:hypothetical protein